MEDLTDFTIEAHMEFPELEKTVLKWECECFDECEAHVRSVLHRITFFNNIEKDFNIPWEWDVMSEIKLLAPEVEKHILGLKFEELFK